MPKMHWRPGAPPGTPLGELTTFPPADPVMGRGGGHPLPIPHSLGVSILALSALRSSSPPRKPGAPRCFRAGYGPAWVEVLGSMSGKMSNIRGGCPEELFVGFLLVEISRNNCTREVSRGMSGGNVSGECPGFVPGNYPGRGNLSGA